MFRLYKKFGFEAYYKSDEPQIGENINEIALHFAFKFLTKIGYNIMPVTENKQLEKKARFVCLMSVLSFTFLTTMGQLGASSPLELLKLFLSYVGILQIIGRLVILEFYKKNLVQLVRNISQFWRIEDVPKADRNTYLKTYKLQNYAFQFYFTMCWSGFLMFLLKACFVSLPFSCWMPFNNSLWYWIVATIQLIFIVSAIFVATGYDTMFVTNCVAIYNQFRMLQAKIYNIDYAGSSSAEVSVQLNECISYHEFLLKCAGHIEEAFNIQLLGLYIIASFSLSIYAVTMALISLNYIEMIEAIDVIIMIAFQLAFYVFPLHEISSKSEEISNALFHSRWYDNDGSYKKNIAIAILRSQRPCEFTAGKFTKMDRVTMLKIYKLSFSIWTLARTMKKART